jgi:hypothetical protein
VVTFWSSAWLPYHVENEPFVVTLMSAFIPE